MSAAGEQQQKQQQRGGGSEEHTNDDEVVLQVATGTSKSVLEAEETVYAQSTTEATMSFVLQLDTVGHATTTTVVENVAKKGIGERQQSTTTPALLIAREVIACPLTTPTAITTVTNAAAVIADTSSNNNNNNDDTTTVNDGSRSSQVLQKVGSGNNQQETLPTAGATSFPTQVKTVLTYPVAKGAREMQRTNTTQVLTTRVISQKLPSSTISHQVQTVPPVAADVISQTTTQTLANSMSLPSPGATGVVYPLQATMCAQAAQPVRNQAAIGEHGKQQQQQQQHTATSNVQTTLHHKLHQVKTITTSATPASSHIQRIHLKTSNIIGQPSQTVNLHKVKTVVANQSTGVQRNSLSRIQGVQQKPQVLTGQMVNQFAVNQTNTPKIQQNSAAEGKALRAGNNLQQQKAQTINAANAQKVVAPSQSVCNNQKVISQVLSTGQHHPNHKIQQQHQYPANQQTTQQQGLQKFQGSQKTTVVSRQQQQPQSTASLNNVSKSCGGTVVGIHKIHTFGHVTTLQQQQTHTPHQKSQSTAATLQKSHTLSTVTNAASRMQNVTNVCKSNSVPNIPKVPQNSNVISVNKQQQQVVSQQSQSSLQLQQQFPQTSQQQQQPVVVQKPQQQSAANANNLQTQKSHSITNLHQKVITAMPNNQRTQTVMSSKVQQQQSQQQQTLMRIGMPAKSQALQSSQPAGLKAVSQKVVNPTKAANSQNTVQQPVQKNSNATQPMKNMQQQQQQQQPHNVMSSQNVQKQPGCIKTIPPQKPVQRNHAQKIGGGGIKTSLNTNVTALKGSTTSTVVQKASIKTLLPQQTIVPNIMAHKTSPIKIQQQVIQQKQLIMPLQYGSSQQIRQQQSGHLKTLIPLIATETRKDPEDM